MEGFFLKNRIIFGIATVIILLVSIPTIGVGGNQPIEKSNLADNQAPIVDSPLDIVYIEGTTGHTITWEISDDDPAYWLIFRNDVHINDSSWVTNNETVIVGIDGLLVGNYEYMILASDSLVNVTDIVLVSVLPSDFEIHAPFSIHSDSSFNDTVQAEGWIGNGSVTNPFIIEKLYIEALYECISIHATTVYFIIRNCTFVGSGMESGIGIGIVMQFVENGIITNCTFTNLWMGCITWSVSNCVWNEGTFGNLLEGIWCQESTDCTITDNTFHSGGISFAGYSVLNWVHNVSGNTIGEKSLGYFEGLSSQTIDVKDYGQTIIANCTDVTINNGDFSGVGVPISIGYSNFTEVYNCNVNGGRQGIFIERTQDTSIDSCSIIGTVEVGININQTVRTEVINCIVLNAGWGGIQIGAGTNVSIIGTTIKDSMDTGIFCYENPHLRVINCTVEKNEYGLQFGGCPESEIISNCFRENYHLGIYVMWDCENTRIFGNEFILNYIENANDDGSGTFWDDGISSGNKWSDYSGSGYYYVPGSGGGIDHYPEYVVPIHIIDIIDVDDILYQYGTTGHEIIWYLNWTHPSMYTIFKDGVSIEHQAIVGNEWIITYNVDGLPIGVYNFTLEIIDEFSYTASDTVFVEVIPEIITTSDVTTIPVNTTPTTNTTGLGGIQEITLVISIGSTIIIVVVIVLMLRTKRGTI